MTRGAGDAWILGAADGALLLGDDSAEDGAPLQGRLERLNRREVPRFSTVFDAERKGIYGISMVISICFFWNFWEFLGFLGFLYDFLGIFGIFGIFWNFWDFWDFGDFWDLNLA